MARRERPEAPRRILVADLEIGNEGYTPSGPRRGKEQDHADQDLPHDEPDEGRKLKSHHQNQAAHASDDAYLDDSAGVACQEETQKEEVGRKTPGPGSILTVLTVDAYRELWEKFRR